MTNKRMTYDEHQKAKEKNKELFKDIDIFGDEYGDGSDEHYTPDGKDSKGFVGKGRNNKED